ncbi:unnamed protein product [Pleuronectes platessa]|uniref:Laminin G domain-containing protein n=1 Tax=Pleuronectes platessa TaxID=8262 RepID=A0A9N7W042_PLEPL|nr:unnamed protein product [Pleuronectes platessa]
MGSFVADVFLLLLISTGQVHGASFYGDGYIHLRTVQSSVQNLLHVRFRTSSQAGLLFLAAGQRDFLLLELISGFLQVRLDLGSVNVYYAQKRAFTLMTWVGTLWS